MTLMLSLDEDAVLRVYLPLSNILEVDTVSAALIGELLFGSCKSPIL